MADENRNAQNNSAESTVKSAVKTGKAVSNITRGAATGGIHGAALETAKASKKWIFALVGIILIPIVIVAMLPSVIFGSLLGDGFQCKLLCGTVLCQQGHRCGIHLEK